MEQYIPKAALVAEIDEIVKALKRQNPDPLGNHTQCLAAAETEALNIVKDIIGTLEVKEVDLEKEFNDFLDNVEGVPRMWHSDEQIEWAKDIAKHFFELGLKAQKGE